MRLLDAGIGQTVRVVRVSGGAGVQSRLQRIGLYAGDELRVLRRAPLGGPVLISTGGRELALGRGVAEHIVVEAD